jgi:hypothetical protein
MSKLQHYRLLIKQYIRNDGRSGHINTATTFQEPHVTSTNEQTWTYAKKSEQQDVSRTHRLPGTVQPPRLPRCLLGCPILHLPAPLFAVRPLPAAKHVSNMHQQVACSTSPATTCCPAAEREAGSHHKVLPARGTSCPRPGQAHLQGRRQLVSSPPPHVLLRRQAGCLLSGDNQC